MKALIRFLVKAVSAKPTPPLPMPVLPFPGPRQPDAVDIAAMFLEDVPAHLVGVALYSRLTHTHAVGGALNSEQLYEISNRVGRLAHAVARAEEARRANEDRVRQKIASAVSSYEARRAGRQHAG